MIIVSVLFFMKINVIITMPIVIIIIIITVIITAIITFIQLEIILLYFSLNVLNVRIFIILIIFISFHSISIWILL